MAFLVNLLEAIFVLSTPFNYICWDPLINFKIQNTKFDFIIVGGGSAGSVVASRLSENPKVNVLLLEAGGCPSFLSGIPGASPTLYNTDVDWSFTTVRQENAFLDCINQQPVYHSGRGLGGGSIINEQMYMRGNKDNFDKWASKGNTGWSYDDVLKFYRKAEGNTIKSQAADTTYHNTEGPLKVSLGPYTTPSVYAFIDSAVQRGYHITDVNGRNQTGVSRVPFTMNNGVRCGTYNAYIEKAKDRSNLVIGPRAFVTKVHFDKTKDQLRAIGVQYIMNNKTYSVYASKEIILSAGALISPKILMLSGIGPKEQLQKFNISVLLNMAGVGQNLQDHVACGALNWKVNCTDCTFNVPQINSPPSILEWTLSREGLLTIPQTIEGVAYILTKYAQPNVPDVQLVYVSGNVQGPPPNLTYILGVDPNKVEPYFGPWANDFTFTIFPFLMVPKSRGEVTLNSSDPTKQPNIDFKYLTNHNDVEVLIEGIKAAIALVNSPAFARFGPVFNPFVYPGCEGPKYQSDDYWECVIRHLTMVVYHPVGTCKMGPSSDLLAVVNPQLQVHNTVQLRVIDNSIMPTIVAGNTNAPAIMIGEKGADMIKKAHNI